MNNKPCNNLEDWLDYISKVHPNKIDMGLERVRAVAIRMGLLPFKPYSVIVAGTNGKGSTTAFMEKSLVSSGYCVGTMASPHLYRFNERIRINGEEVEDGTITEAFERIDEVRGDITLSYFEFVTLAALEIFKSKSIQIALLEVGLGGRLDAVNIVDADVVIITNIALDHMAYLGPDRESIGREKAGILRKGIPLIYGEEHMPKSIDIISKELKNPVRQFGKDYDVSEKIISKANIPPENIANAMAALDVMKHEFPVKHDLIEQVAADFVMNGRWQVIQNPYTEIFDVAHNPHGVARLSKMLSTYSVHGKNLAVFSMLNTKDIRSCLSLIKPHIHYWFIAPLENEASLSQTQLSQAFLDGEIDNVSYFKNIKEAYKSAKAKLTSNDRLLVFGSFHTVAEIGQLKV